jgi:iron complex outermembrane receptor protein
MDAWSANTANVRLEYYFAGVSQISINAFRRDFENFFGATRFPATPEFLALYDVDAATYGEFDVETQFNVPGTVRMEGSSFNYKQALTFLPPWARGVQVFANYSTQRRTGALVGDSGFPFYPRTGNWGVSLTRQKFQARINWNYRSSRQGAAVTGASIGPDTFNWVPKQVTYDVQLDYYFYRSFAVFGSLRNAGEIPADTHIYGPLTPEPARFRNRIDWGSLWTFGIKGTF